MNIEYNTNQLVDAIKKIKKEDRSNKSINNYKSVIELNVCNRNRIFL